MMSKSSSEDFATLDGKVVKLGSAVLKESTSSDALMQPKKISVVATSQTPSHCALDYTPVHESETMVYGVMIAFSQKATWGKFNGHCDINGEKIDLTDIYGFFELIHMRW